MGFQVTGCAPVLLVAQYKSKTAGNTEQTIGSLKRLAIDATLKTSTPNAQTGGHYA